MDNRGRALTREQAIEFAERWFDRKWGNDGQYQSLMETMVERLLALGEARAAIEGEPSREFKFTRYEDWIASLPKCLPWDQCDGDLPGEPHADNCLMKGKEPATFRDAFEAGRAERVLEAPPREEKK